MLLLMLIVILAATLRFTWLGEVEVTADEPLYSVRNIGWLDVLYGSDQPTVYHMLDKLPWWTNLSFHDHPPLTFAINYIIHKIFGISLFVSRLGSVFFGIFSVILIFLVGKKMKNEKVGLLAAFIMAVSVMPVYISRIAIMESIALFFVLLTFYLFILACDNIKYLTWFGVVVGLSLLAKYTAFFPLPIYLVYLLVYRRGYFKKFKFYLAIFLGLLVFSPVIIYNIALYNNLGHFDLQFSFLLGQDSAQYWSNPVGKELRGGIIKRISGLMFYGSFLTPPFLFFFIFSLFVNLLEIRKKEDRNNRTRNLGLLISVMTVFLFSTFLIGSNFRFLVYPMPFFIILISLLFLNLYNLLGKKVFFVIFILFFAYELFFSINVNHLYNKNNLLGWNRITYSKGYLIRPIGVEELNQYFLQEFFGRKSYFQPIFANRNIQTKITKILENKKDNDIDKEIYKALLIHDERASIKTYEWIFSKYSFYMGWPYVGMDYFLENIDYFNEEEFGDVVFYYVLTLDGTERNESRKSYIISDIYGDFLEKLGAEFEVIKNKKGEQAFKVYKANLDQVKSVKVNFNPSSAKDGR